MYRSILGSIFFGFAGICHALPTSPFKKVVIGNAQDTCQVTLSTEVNFGGEGVVVVGPAGQCVSMSQIGPEYSNSVSSFGIDDGCICTIVTNTNCYDIGQGLHLAPPGEPNLANDPGWNDAAGSYLCNR
ncbi:hypothetical protein AOQ84DRAFT_380779 [Glonium stellatum]|uniref:Uncharacterized protein n=1 Tax=Glonium stellatum TaxID=574774 RepID=A0A8E2JPG1_9PEZI|nr:hypothetical protein AOQ84DRAFT_380779 [Glonium stellatum]